MTKSPDDGADQTDWEGLNGGDREAGMYAHLCPDDRLAEFEYGACCIVDSTKTGDADDIVGVLRIVKGLPEKPKAPIKIRRDLEQLANALTRLSPDAEELVNNAARSQEYYRYFVKLVRQLDEVPGLFSADDSVREAARSALPSNTSIAEATRQQGAEAFRRLPVAAKEDLKKVWLNQNARRNGPVDQMLKLIGRALDNVVDQRHGPDKLRLKLGRDAWAIWCAHGGNVADERFKDFVFDLIYNAGLDTDGKSKARINLDTLVREIRNNAKERRAPPWQLWERDHPDAT